MDVFKFDPPGAALDFHGNTVRRLRIASLAALCLV
jgi:hypothetical protein